jgi:hypothetical protein
MKVIDGKLTVANSHLGFLLPERPCSESSFSVELSHHDSDDDSRMDFDDESDDERSESAAFSLNAREYSHWGDLDDNQPRDCI